MTGIHQLLFTNFAASGGGFPTELEFLVIAG
jgi:hypothetical protein